MQRKLVFVVLVFSVLAIAVLPLASSPALARLPNPSVSAPDGVKLYARSMPPGSIPTPNTRAIFPLIPTNRAT